MKVQYFSGVISEEFWPACASGFRVLEVKVGRKWVYGREVSNWPRAFKKVRYSVWEAAASSRRRGQYPLIEISKPKFLKKNKKNKACIIR